MTYCDLMCHTALTVNPIDSQMQETGYFVKEYPVILGTDVAGVVEAVGSAVTGYKKGDRVFFQGRIGVSEESGFQEYTIVEQDIVSKTPDNISDDAAASIPVAAVAALVALFREGGKKFPSDGPTVSEEPILIVAGSSSVGQYAIQFARLAGFSPIITTAAPKHKALLERLGATHVIDRNSSNAASEIREIAPSLTLVFDCVAEKDTQQLGLDSIGASATNAKLLTAIAPNGEVVNASKRREHPVEIKGIYGSSHLFRDVSIPFYTAIGGWLKSGKFVPNNVEVVGGLDDVQAGLDKLKAGVSAVKLIIKP